MIKSAQCCIADRRHRQPHAECAGGFIARRGHHTLVYLMLLAFAALSEDD
jgi:hypothetical protein